MNRAKWIALAVLLGLQVADAATTLAVLHAGGFELNPLVRLLSLWGAKAAVFAAVCLLAWITTHPKRLWVLCGVYGTIVIWNSSLLWTR